MPFYFYFSNFKCVVVGIRRQIAKATVTMVWPERCLNSSNEGSQMTKTNFPLPLNSYGPPNKLDVCRLVLALSWLRKEGFSGETPSWQNEWGADMRMKQQTPTLLWGACFCCREHASALLGDHMGFCMSEYNSGIQPHMCDTISWIMLTRVRHRHPTALM